MRGKKLMSGIAYMRERCKQLLDTPPGIHASTDHLQRAVAEEAWGLLQAYGKQPASGVFTSPLGVIASLLFEAVTGKPDAALQRACKAVLSEHRLS
jgi:hypothetical protein